MRKLYERELKAWPGEFSAAAKLVTGVKNRKSIGKDEKAYDLWEGMDRGMVL